MRAVRPGHWPPMILDPGGERVQAKHGQTGTTDGGSPRGGSLSGSRKNCSVFGQTGTTDGGSRRGGSLSGSRKTCSVFGQTGVAEGRSGGRTGSTDADINEELPTQPHVDKVFYITESQELSHPVLLYDAAESRSISVRAVFDSGAGLGYLSTWSIRGVYRVGQSRSTGSGTFSEDIGSLDH
jgi:hypothetical protein